METVMQLFWDRKKLPSVSHDEFNCWLKNFISKDLSFEADMVFIDLFQDGNEYSHCSTLSERIAEYVANYPQKKKIVSSVADHLLDFLENREIISRWESARERKEINRLVRGD